MNTQDASRIFDAMVSVLRPIIKDEVVLQSAALAAAEEALNIAVCAVNQRLNAVREATGPREASDAQALLRQALADRRRAPV